MPAGSSGGVALLSTLMACGLNGVFLLLLYRCFMDIYNCNEKKRPRFTAIKSWCMIIVSPQMALNCTAGARKFVYSTAILLTMMVPSIVGIGRKWLIIQSTIWYVQSSYQLTSYS